MKSKCVIKDFLLFRVLIVLFLLSSGITGAWAQVKTITGFVKDQKGNPLPGVTLRVQETKAGTSTKIDGSYSIRVVKGNAISFAFIGYKGTTLIVGDANVYNIVLNDSQEQLDEVVVVGFGVQKKESVVAAISQIDSKELLKSSSPNISQAIAGRLPGVMTSQTSGAPGADDAAIFIRGRASFSSDNQPLILVDGVERKYSQISPDDIETISILKDASATAVYGVRGANGVVLITTKRGRDSKPEVSLSANFQSQTPTRKNTYLDSYNSVTLLEEALRNDGLPSQYTTDDIDMFRKSSLGQLNAAQSQLYPNVNWYDAILRSSSPAARYNATIRGGTRRMRYFTSLDYYNQDGLYKNVSTYEYDRSSNTDFKRYGFRANLDFDLTKRMVLSVNFATRFEERQGPNIANENTTSTNPDNQLFYEINHTPGWLFPVRYENGFYGGNAQNKNNIVAMLAKGGFYQRTNTVNETNFNLKHDLDFVTKGLSARGLVSFDYETYYNRRFTAGFATYELINRNNPELESSYTRYNEDQELSYAGNTQTTMMKIYMEYALNYQRTFGTKHNVTGLLLYNQNDYRTQSELARRYQGLVGRVTYNYASRYFAELNAGFNGSENFIKGKRFGFFPSMSAGWLVSNESFMESSRSWLNTLKLKASYGEVGNDRYQVNGADVRFLYIPTWLQLSNSYLFGDTNWQTGIYEGNYPNYSVTWEKARKYNVGLESAFLNNMFTFNVDVFKESRGNILTGYLTKPEWLGVALAPGNLGKTTNQGFELDLKHNYKIGKVNYFASFNFTHAKNKIIDMNEPDLKTAYRKQEGHPIGQFFGLVSEGFVTSADINSGTLPQSTFGTVKAGDLKYKDMNADGFIDERDQTFIGYSNLPQNTFSFSVGADWKGFALSAMFQGVGKVSRYYDAEAMFAFVNGGKVKEHHLDRWNPGVSEAQNLASAKYPLLHYDQNGNHNQRVNSFFVKDGSFMRLKNVELSYSFPNEMTKRLKMRDLRVFVNGNNLITWDKLDKITDPENEGSNRYPIMRSVNFGVNVRF